MAVAAELRAAPRAEPRGGARARRARATSCRSGPASSTTARRRSRPSSSCAPASRGGPCFLLESAEQGQVGRYSFLGFRPRAVLRWSDGVLSEWSGEAAGGRPTAASRRPTPTRRSPSTSPRYQLGPGRGPAAVRRRRRRLLRLRPGAHGRAARRAQPRPARAARHGADDHRRDARLRPPAPRADDHRLRLRRRRGRRSTPPTSAPRRRSPTCASACAAPCRRPARPRSPSRRAFASNMEREEFEAAVARIVEYVHAGDAFQVVPSQRFSAPAPVEAFSIYRGLRAVNPSPYMYFLEFGDFQIAGASPEPLVKVSGDRVETRPIAGTYPRGGERGGGPPPRRAAGQRPQGAGRARDAGRPRPQRPRPRLRVRHASRSTS